MLIKLNRFWCYCFSYVILYLEISDLLTGGGPGTLLTEGVYQSKVEIIHTYTTRMTHTHTHMFILA